jgi:hypothetical protein
MEDTVMKRSPTILAALVLIGGLSLEVPRAWAHCDAVDGPVAAAAVKALETKNLNLVLPYAPASAEPELTAAFEQALIVRVNGPEAKALADRYFMETAVRVHRAGEKAPYTGLKPAGTDFGPAIRAAEQALASGELDLLLKLMTQEVVHSVTERFRHTLATKAATKEPATKSEVPAARERVSAELEFIGFVEGISRATRGGGLAEGHPE